SLPHPLSSYSKAYLFNNAGSLGALKKIKDQKTNNIRTAIDLNVTAPMALTSHFLRAFSSTEFLSIVNVSSLAAWGIYCAGKAARDMFHKTIAEESNHTGNQIVRVLNYAPGPLDTDMQTQIRDTMPDGPIKDIYVNMHKEGKLVPPATSASTLIRLLEADTFANG
ncbi:hypothetical protein HK096_002053, partial [Nowakowskiella sp. JEL0078]